MLSSVVDPYDVPPAWWETDCVRYGMNYTPVRSRLTSLMGSHIVRLTDRKYMIRLASKLQEDYETRQRARIEQRKLRIASVVPDLRELAPKLKTTQRRRECSTKIHAYAVKKCKELPQLLLEDDSKSCVPTPDA